MALTPITLLGTTARASEAWPVITNLPFLLPLGSEQLDCVKTKALVNWIYWTQTNGQAFQLAEGYLPFSAV
jgi:hypothetical protein